MQTDIIEVHLARAAGRGQVAPGTEADSNLIDIGQVNALIGKCLQVDIPLRPFGK